MKLNREQIIKALECCANEGFQDCESCPLNIPHQPCSKVKLPRISLALIKELTEENERLRWISAHVCVGNVITSEQMEELRMAHTLPGMHGDPVGEPGECGLKRDCVADAVRRMQEKLEKEIDRTIDMFDFQISEFDAVRQALRGVKNDIYQVAKEMLEENK